ATAQWYLDAMREQGALPVLAHPYWSALTLRDITPLHGYLGLEVFNADTEVHIGRGNSQALWDDLLCHGIHTFGLGVDDCHRPGQDSLRGWTMVRAADNSTESILAALSRGDFYASSGPQIDAVETELNLDEETGGYKGTVTVRCSPARAISLVA